MGVRSADGRLVVFPEHLGFLLALLPFNAATAERAPTFAEFIDAAAEGRNPRDLVSEHAIEVANFYDDLFSSIAAEHGIYVVNGSITLPEMDESPHRGGRIASADRAL